jgi:ATP-dependent DNA helicase RecG
MKPWADTPIEFLKGVGPERGKVLRTELGMATFGDLLHHFPFRYIDRSQFHTVESLDPELGDVQLRGRISNVRESGAGKGQRLNADFTDDTGTVELVWFKGIKWVRPTLGHTGEYIIFGRPTVYRDRLNMAHPEVERVVPGEARKGGMLQPVYSSTEKARAMSLDSKGLAKLTLALCAELGGKVPESLDSPLRDSLGLMPLEAALREVHVPTGHDALRLARHRLKFDELFFLQLRLLQLKVLSRQRERGAVFAKVGTCFNTFYQHHMPFELTGAQKRVLKEIRADTATGQRMSRLVQGDVGSGKTVVALMAMLLALDNGYQAAMMAPTELLAEQHFRTIGGMLKDMPVQVGLLTGSVAQSARRPLLQACAEGSLQILIGTHALIEDAVQFRNLGLVVVDEQHRFGVRQRAKVGMSGGTDTPYAPHTLLMSATPIPRTLALTVYGDLDVSSIDELPPGRKPIVTTHRFDAQRLAVFGFLREQLRAGRQVYIVYPLIDESEKVDLKHLTDGYEAIQRDFPEFKVGIVHGRMKGEDKDFEMMRFKERKTQILVATTVIEVGVDVPNASVMVIENADRFGLAQLHQLRGRVGRGAEQSYCILMTTYQLSRDARTRLETMVRTNNGFEIAEVDLKLRGPGDIQGTQQSGMPQFRISDITKDGPILQQAREVALHITDIDPDLRHPDHTTIAATLDSLIAQHADWARVG